MTLTFGRRRPCWNGSVRTLSAASGPLGDRVEKQNRSREAVYVVDTSDGADLTGTRHAGYSHGGEPVDQVIGVVTGKTEEMASPTVAGEGESGPG